MAINSEAGLNSDGVNIDRVLIGAVCYFPNEQSVPAQVRSAGRAMKIRSDKSVAVRFKTFEAESNDATVRQEDFLSALAAARTQLNAAGVDKDMLCRCGAQLGLRMTFFPVNGQAGIVFTGDELRAWNELGADIYIDSFPND